MDKVHVYMCLHTTSIKSAAGKKPGFLLVRSTFLLTRASLWPKRSGTTT